MNSCHKLSKSYHCLHLSNITWKLEEFNNICFLWHQKMPLICDSYTSERFIWFNPQFSLQSQKYASRFLVIKCVWDLTLPFDIGLFVLNFSLEFCIIVILLFTLSFCVFWFGTKMINAQRRHFYLKLCKLDNCYKSYILRYWSALNKFKASSILVFCHILNSQIENQMTKP